MGQERARRTLSNRDFFMFVPRSLTEVSVPSQALRLSQLTAPENSSDPHGPGAPATHADYYGRTLRGAAYAGFHSRYVQGLPFPRRD